MTGFGEAYWQSERLTVSIELRAVNNRYLKVSLRATEPYHLLEPEFEKLVRKTVRRGTIQVHLRVQRQFAPQDYQLNVVALSSYIDQLRAVGDKLGLTKGTDILLSQALALPGVVIEPGQQPGQLTEDWQIVEPVLQQAVDRLQAMRQEEGRAMATELLAQRDVIGTQLQAIRERAPQVVTQFRDRLFERVRSLIGELDVKLDRSDVIKEVSVFAERSDIAEEITRLASHLEQFEKFVQEPESAGRKLEFLTQEMFRETNTIGSKASDVAVSRYVVEIKSALEKIRELVQNVE